MERAVWVCACAMALIVAMGISSMSSATNSSSSSHNTKSKFDSKSLEITTCKATSNCVESSIKPIGRTSEMFLRKIKRVLRKAYA